MEVAACGGERGGGRACGRENVRGGLKVAKSNAACLWQKPPASSLERLEIVSDTSKEGRKGGVKKRHIGSQAGRTMAA